MGYGFMPYAVDLNAVRRVFGSKDEELLKEIIRKHNVPADDDDPDEMEYEDEFDDDEEGEDDEGDGGADGVMPSSQAALRQMVMGEPYNRGCGFKYGYLFKTLCEHFGRMLDNTAWERSGGEYNSAFDTVLKKLRVPAGLLRVDSHLTVRDPVDLPQRNDFPCIGYLSRDEAAAVLQVLDGLDPATVRTAATGVRTRRGTVPPDDVIACLDEIKGWCQECVAKNLDLVTFYH